MTKIIVKNGDWDTARAELAAMMKKNQDSFDAQLEAAFGGPRWPAPRPAATPAPTPVQSTGKLVLARSSRRG